MIVTCPSCATRTSFPQALKVPGSVKITCRTCGHTWLEIEDDDIVDVSPYRRPLDALPKLVVQDAEETDIDVDRLLSAARRAEDQFAERQVMRRRAARHWGAYAVSVALLAGAAMSFPDWIVRTAPAAIRAYDAMGMNVNIYGLEIRKVKQQHTLANGVRVLTIKGDIVNTTRQERKIPWLRFGMRDVASKEVYSWTLDTEARPLKPGESTGFVTRVAAPPEAASDVEIRFAHEDETGIKPQS